MSSIQQVAPLFVSHHLMTCDCAMSLHTTLHDRFFSIYLQNKQAIDFVVCVDSSIRREREYIESFVFVLVSNSRINIECRSLYYCSRKPQALKKVKLYSWTSADRPNNVLYRSGNGCFVNSCPGCVCYSNYYITFFKEKIIFKGPGPGSGMIGDKSKKLINKKKSKKLFVRFFLNSVSFYEWHN